MITPDALYEILKRDLQFTIDRKVSHDSETIPLHVKRFSASHLQENFLKKFVPRRDSALDLEALRVFTESNNLCATWALPVNLSSSDEMLLGEFSKILEDFFLQDLGNDCELSWSNICLNARCGPGVAVGTTNTSHYGKMYCGNLTATDPFLLDLYRADVGMWPEEANAEIIRQANFGSATVVRGSRSSFVPKTAKVSRMISVEPAVNMFYQLGLGEILLKRLKRFFGIDLATQASLNRYLAYVGSSVDATFGDGFSTIDLSSASDSLSLKLGQSVIPAEWFSTLLALRSDSSEVLVDGQKFNVKLNMLSTMGNGFTFPLQTAVFASIASACVSLSDDIREKPRGFSLIRPGAFSVFGDDIIVPSKIFERTCRLLRLLGFRPNPEKSFSSGSFRESCGHDYYCGYNVRPVYLRNLETDTDLMVITNLLVDWSARNEIRISNTIEYCVNRLKLVNLVPMCEGMDSGLRVPFSIASTFGRLKRNLKLQSYVYTKRHAHSKRLRILDGYIQVPAGVTRHIYNPSGLLVAFLRGEVRNSTISLRSWKSVYRTKRAVAPNWDYSVTSLEASLIGTALSPFALAKRYALILEDALAGAQKDRRIA